MICFVDIEHEKVQQEAEKRNNHWANRTAIKVKLEDITGDACLIQHYRRVTRQRLRDWGIKALAISGNSTDFFEYDDGAFDEMYEIIRAPELPIIGFCGGCQLIAMAHGVPLGPMRRLREGETDAYSEYQPEWFKERGFMPIRVLKPDPLFDGLGKAPIMFESHYWEAKEMPPGFELLASTDECRVQAIKRQDKLVYATQFHPELYSEEQDAGRKLLANFFRLAGLSR